MENSEKTIALVTKETPVTELFSYFLHLLKANPYHSFITKWQKEQFHNLVNNLPLDNIIYIMISLKVTHVDLKMQFNPSTLTQTK